MYVERAYHYLLLGALIWFAVLIGLMLIRSIIGPRITDRILSINMIGTMVICCIAILSQLLNESYLLDVALIYAMISLVTVLILATVYISVKKKRGKYAGSAIKEMKEEGICQVLPEEAGAKRDERLSGSEKKKTAEGGEAL